MPTGLRPRSSTPGHHALGLGLSFGLHAALVASFLFWGSAEAETERPVITPAQIINTKLVALGKKRPKKLLPRIKKPRKPKPRKATSLGQEVRKDKADKPRKKAPKEAAPEEKDEPDRSVDDILAQFNQERKDDPRGDEDDPEGDPNGHALGTSTSGRVKAVYGDRIGGMLNGTVSYALLTPEELKKLKARVNVEVDAQGKIAGFRFVKHSGNGRFDESVTRALRIFGVDGPRSFPPFPQDAGFGDSFKAQIVFNPTKR